MRPILTAKKGTNADLFPDIIDLYLPERPSSYNVLDMTYGNGVFWKNVNRSDIAIWKNDIDPERGAFHYDFGNLSEHWTDRFDAVVLDPPYLYVGGWKTLKKSIDKGYKNVERATRGIWGVAGVHQMYARGFLEAYRILHKKGIFIVKCMDQVTSGKQVWQHTELIRLAVILGFRNEDLFVMISNSTPTMRHKHQLHARKNHSYFLIFKKP